MAKENGENVERHPEQRLADRILTKYEQSPPVDVEMLIKRYAIVQHAKPPSNADAVVFHAGPTESKARVILNDTKPPRRVRFTLAHELGHILIPWHIGTISCHVLAESIGGSTEYSEFEVQANRFASELLMPRPWLLQIAAGSDPFPEKVEEVARQANVSAHAATLAITQAMPSGHAAIGTDRSGNITFVVKSPGTVPKLPVRGTRFDCDSLKSLTAQYGQIKDDIHLFAFRTKLRLGDDTCIDSTSILNEIVTLAGGTDADRRKLVQRINGIIGSANNIHGSTDAEQFYSTLVQRFANRPELEEITSHARFPLFLSSRARELAERSRKK